MKNLLEIENFNYVIVYKNKNFNLKNILSGDRLERYYQASRDETKLKLLSGSYFIYRCLKDLGYPEETCQKAFSEKSCYLIKLPQGNISYSNSGDYHVLTYSIDDATGVDIEAYIDRSDSTYQKFLKLTSEDKENLKERFYQKWLEKEIIYKQPKVNCINYFTLENYIFGYAFNNKKEVKVVQLLDTNLGKLKTTNV